MNKGKIRKLAAAVAEGVQTLRRVQVLSVALSGAIDPDGGAAGAGLISGVSVITLGEAQGWDAWIDGEMLDLLVGFGRAAGETGIKARFSHPGLCEDGIGKTLGRFVNWRRDGDKVLADLHFFKSAHKAPGGDLAGYVLEHAAEAPTFFGASVEFHSDHAAEYDFYKSHMDAEGRFISPDPDNAANLEHLRPADLWAAALVDNPAANPDGLFSATGGNKLAAAGEALVGYALGVSDERPVALAGLPDADKVRGFVAGYLERHGLAVVESQGTGTSRQGSLEPVPGFTTGEDVGLTQPHAPRPSADGNDNAPTAPRPAGLTQSARMPGGERTNLDDGQAEQIAALQKYEERLEGLERLTKSLATTVDILKRRMSA